MLEVEFDTETVAAQAGLHEEVDALIIGIGRGGRLRVEGSLAVDQPQVAAHERDVDRADVAEPPLGQRIADRRLLQADVGRIVDVVRIDLAGADRGVPRLGVHLALIDRDAALVAGCGRGFRHAVTVEIGLRRESTLPPTRAWSWKPARNPL